MTPTNFSMITGLRVRGLLLYYLNNISVRLDEVGELIVVVPEDIIVPARWLYDTFVGKTSFTDAQMTRAFILYVLGCFLLSTRGNQVEVSLLGSLVEIDRIYKYDWGGAGLALLYQHMGEVVRGVQCPGRLLAGVGGTVLLLLHLSFPLCFLDIS